MPRTHRIYPTSGVPISEVPPSEIVDHLRARMAGRWEPEMLRAVAWIEWAAGRLGDDVAKANLLERSVE
jgi:hypothetical protein